MSGQRGQSDRRSAIAAAIERVEQARAKEEEAYQRARPLSLNVGHARSKVTDLVLRALLDGEPVAETMQAAGYAGQWYFVTEEFGRNVTAWLRFTSGDQIEGTDSI